MYTNPPRSARRGEIGDPGHSGSAAVKSRPRDPGTHPVRRGDRRPDLLHPTDTLRPQQVEAPRYPGVTDRQALRRRCAVIFRRPYKQHRGRGTLDPVLPLIAGVQHRIDHIGILGSRHTGVPCFHERRGPRGDLAAPVSRQDSTDRLDRVALAFLAVSMNPAISACGVRVPHEEKSWPPSKWPRLHAAAFSAFNRLISRRFARGRALPSAGIVPRPAPPSGAPSPSPAASALATPPQPPTRTHPWTCSNRGTTHSFHCVDQSLA